MITINDNNRKTHHINATTKNNTKNNNNYEIMTMAIIMIFTNVEKKVKFRFCFVCNCFVCWPFPSLFSVPHYYNSVLSLYLSLCFSVNLLKNKIHTHWITYTLAQKHIQIRFFFLRRNQNNKNRNKGTKKMGENIYLMCYLLLFFVFFFAIH